MKSKICGIPSLEVAKRVIAARPDAIGVYCWTNPEKGRNFTDKETARQIVRLASESAIDSFYLMYEDAPISAEKAYEDCSFIGTTHVQIVGDMSVEEITKLKRMLPTLRIVKRIGVAGPGSIKEALLYDACEGVDQLLLDSSFGAVARGGTGKTHDWNVSRQIVMQCSKPVWLAGGIRLHNVEGAMQAVRPYGVDVETGVQLPDGAKDYPAIEEFIAKVHNFMPEPQLTRIVAGCVLEKDGQYLLVQEKKEAVKGKWNLPAGRVYVGETIEQAAVRETFEESGYKVELGKKLRVEHDDALRPVLHSFKARIVGGDLKFPQHELLNAKWLTMEEIEALQGNGKIRAEWVINSIRDAQTAGD